jgi:putative membrane protein
MNTLSPRLMLVCVIAILFLVPVYAHHGNQFLSKVMETNAAEVRLGEMAVNKTRNARVKDFAETVVRDHKQALEKINELRETRTTTSVITDTTAGATTRDTNERARSTPDIHRKATDVPLTPEHQRTADRLSSLPASDFDREFINEMVRGHREAIRDFEAQSHVHGYDTTTRNETGTAAGQQIARQKPAASEADLLRDTDTAEFAIEMLPILRHHLEEAAAIQRELQRR